MRQRYGFTIVELTIALVVGLLLMGSAYQLFNTISRNSSDAQRQSQASNVAYDLLRRTENDSTILTDPCGKSSPAVRTPSIPDYANLQGTVRIEVSCPQGALSSLNTVSVTVTYNNSTGKAQVTRAITTRQS